MDKYHNEFPVYYQKKWKEINNEFKKKSINTILKNADNRTEIPNGIRIQEDPDLIFDILQKDFLKLIEKNFEVKPIKSYSNIVVYTENPEDLINDPIDSQGEKRYYNYKHIREADNKNVINGIFFLSIQDSQTGFINFRREEIQTETNQIFIGKDFDYNRNNPKPYKKIDGVRKTIVKTITYIPEEGDILFIPNYLDRCEFRSLTHGPHIVVTFTVLIDKKLEDIFNNEY
jgi:hypothetical protein